MKKRSEFAVLGVVAAALVLCAAGCGGKKEGDAADAYTQGRIELEQGNVQKAVTLLEKAAAEKPNDATITYWLGESYRQGNATKEAINEFKRVLSYDPSYVRAHLKIAECEIVLGRKVNVSGTAAKEELEHYLSAEQHCNQAIGFLEGETLAKPGDAALKALLGEASMTLGKVYAISDREEEALAQFDKALTRDPELIEAYLEKAQLLAADRNYDEAEEICYKGVDRIKARLSQEKAKAGDNQEKIKSITKTANQDTYRLMSLVAQIENVCDRNATAIEILTEIIPYAPTQLEEKNSRFLLGTLYLDTHKLDAAEEQADEIQKLDRRYPHTNYLRGRVFLARGAKLREDDPKSEKAAQLLDQAVNELVTYTNSKSPLYLYYLGRAYQLRGGRDEQALTELKKTLENIDPGTNEQIAAQTHLAIADIRLRKGAYEEAESHYKEVLKVWRNNIEAKRGLATLYMITRRVQEARSLMGEVGDVDPGSGIDYARFVFLSGETRRGIELIEEAIERTGTKNPNAYYLRGFMYQHVGDYVRAAGSFEQTIRLDDTFSAAYISLAQTLVANNQRDKAIEMLKDYMTRQPRQPEGPAFLGQLHENEGEYDKAIEFYRESLNRNREFVPGYRIARLYLMKDQTDEAIRRWEELQSIASQKNVRLPLATLNLSFAKLIGGRHAEAIDLLTKLQEDFQDRPNAFVLHRVIAELYAGSVENARRVLQSIAGVTRNNVAPVADFIAKCEREPDKTAVRQVLKSLIFSVIDTNEQDHKMAAKRIEEALAEWPGNLLLHKRRAEIYTSIPGSEARDVVTEECRKMIELAPGYAIPHIYLALMAEMREDFDQAASMYERAVSLDPEAVDPRFRLARLKFQKKQYEDVHRLLNEVLTLAPGHIDAMKLQVITYDAQDNREMVARLLPGIDRAEPNDPRIKLQMARIELSDGNYDKAADICDQGLAAAPSDTNLRALKAEALVRRGRTGDLEKAIEVLREALAINDYNHLLYLQLAEIYRASPLTVSAAESVLQSGLRKMPDNPQLTRAMAETYLAAGKLDRAEEYLNALLGDDENERVELLRHQISFLKALRTPIREEQKKQLDEIVASVSDLAAKSNARGQTFEGYQAQLLLGRIYLHGYNDKTLATRMFEEASRTQPNQTAPYAWLAPLYYSRGLYADCERALGKLAVNAFNTSRSAISRQASGNLQEAERIARLALQQPPDQKDNCRLVLANILLQAGRPDEAAAEADKAISIDKQMLSSYRALAKSLTGATRIAVARETNNALFYVLSRQPEEAARHLAEALKESRTNNIFLLMRLALAHLEARQFDEAASHLNQVIKLQPDYLPAFISLANVYEVQNKLTEAIHTYQLAFEREPENVELAMQLALIHHRVGKLPEAQNYYRKAIALDPERSSLHYNLGRTLEAQGLIEPALEQYDRAIELAPKDRETFGAYNNAAWHYATKKNPDLKRALFYALKAFDMMPQMPEVRDTLGWIHFLRENYQEAENQLKVAARDLPANGSVQYHHAAALAKNGKIQEAILTLESAVDLTFPEEYDKKRAQELLSELKTGR